jgi:hypothetical protein
MIRLKQQVNKKHANFATARLNIQRELDIAIQNGDEVLQEKYSQELTELDEQKERARPDSTKTDAFAELNKRNRSINVKEGQEAGGRKRAESVGDEGGSEVVGGVEVKLLDEAHLLDDDWLDDIDMALYAC